MENLFHVDVVTPEKFIYSGKAVSLVVPAEFGYMGVLADHAPLVSRLIKGTIDIEDSSKEKKSFNVDSKGFMEILNNNVSIVLAEGG